MKHYTYLIGAKGDLYASQVGIYGNRTPVSVVKKMTSDGEDAVLVHEHELNFSENISRFFLAMQQLFNGVRCMSTIERARLGFYFNSEYDYYQVKGQFYTPGKRRKK